MATKYRCWKPQLRAPRLTEMSLLSSDEDLIFFKNIQKKYNCSKFPWELLGETEPIDIASQSVPEKGPQILYEEVRLKQNPGVIPEQNSALSFGQSNISATQVSSFRQISNTESDTYRQSQIFQCEIKTEDFLSEVTGGESQPQEKMNFVPKEEMYFKQLHSHTFSSGRKRKLVAHNNASVSKDNLDHNFQQGRLLLSGTDEVGQYYSPASKEPENGEKVCLIQQNKASLLVVPQCLSFSPQIKSGMNPEKYFFSSSHVSQGTDYLQPLTKPIPPDFISQKFFDPMVCGSKHLKRLQSSSTVGTASILPVSQKMDVNALEHITSHQMPPSSFRNSSENATLSTLSQINVSAKEPAEVGREQIFRSGLESLKLNTSLNAQQIEAITSAQEVQLWDNELFLANKAKSAGNEPGEESLRADSICPAKMCLDDKGWTLGVAAEKRGSLARHKKTSRERILEKLEIFAPQNQEDPAARKKADTSVSLKVPNPDKDLGLVAILDISTMSEAQREQATARLEINRTMSFMVLFKDNTVNTDSSQLNRAKVKGILLQCEGSTYLLPVADHGNIETSQWSRNVLNALLNNSKIVKVAINCKRLVITLLEEFSLGDNRGSICWQFEDPIIGGWLLKPDNPPCTLYALCKTFGVALQQDGEPCEALMATVLLMEKIRASLVAEGLWPLFRQVEMPLTPLLAVMELQPIRVHIQTFLTFSDVLKKKLSKLEQTAYQLAGHVFCINSTQQLRQLLYEELQLDHKIPGSKKMTLTAATHHKSTSEPMLRQLTTVHPLPSVILEYRHLQKLKSTYVDGMLETVQEGTLHTHWDQTAAATGRLSSFSPNLQAVPKTPTLITDFEDSFIVGSASKCFEILAREPYISNEGNVFLAADFQQIELRLFAHLTNDSGLKAIFTAENKSFDVFIQLAAQWLSKPCCDITHSEREQTKRVVYSILYGVGKERLAEYLKVSSCKALDIMNSFLVTFPAIQVFTRKCIDYAKQHGYTETVMGRRRWFPRVHHKAPHIRAQAERQAVNFCVQGSAADICKQAMLKVEEALSKRPHLSARLLIQIHDELVWELPQDQFSETHDLIKCVMEDDALLCQPMLDSLRVPITVSLSSAACWAHLKSCV